MTEAQRFHYDEAVRAIESLRIALKNLIRSTEKEDFSEEHTSGLVSGLLMGLNLFLHSDYAKWNR